MFSKCLLEISVLRMWCQLELKDNQPVTALHAIALQPLIPLAFALKSLWHIFCNLNRLIATSFLKVEIFTITDKIMQK